MAHFKELSRYEGNKMMRQAAKACGFEDWQNFYTTSGAATYRESAETCAMGEAEVQRGNTVTEYHFFTYDLYASPTKWEFDIISTRRINEFKSAADAIKWFDSVVGG